MCHKWSWQHYNYVVILYCLEPEINITATYSMHTGNFTIWCIFPVPAYFKKKKFHYWWRLPCLYSFPLACIWAVCDLRQLRRLIRKVMLSNTWERSSFKISGGTLCPFSESAQRKDFLHICYVSSLAQAPPCFHPLSLPSTQYPLSIWAMMKQGPENVLARDKNAWTRSSPVHISSPTMLQIFHGLSVEAP